MRRTIGTLAAAGLLTTMLLVPASAEDTPATDAAPAADESARKEHRRIEKLELRCAVIEHGEHKGVGCDWSPSKHPEFAAYELWRGTSAEDKALLFRSDDRELTRYFDADAARNHKYGVRALDADGRMIAASRIVAPGHRHGDKPRHTDAAPADAKPHDKTLHEQPARPDRPGDRPAHRPDKVEPLSLDCRRIEHGDRSGVACHWSGSHHPAFAGYRLMRAARDERPAVVFESRERRMTKALDETAEPGRPYVYVVEAVAEDGTVVGRSRPAPVRGEPRPEPAPRDGALTVPSL